MKKMFENMKISKKLITGFLLIAVLVIVVGAIGIVNITGQLRDQQTTFSENTMGIKDADDAQMDFINLRVCILKLCVYYDMPANRNKNIDEAKELLAVADQSVNDYASLLSDTQDRANYDALKTSFAAYAKAVNNIMTAAEAGKPVGDILAIIEDAGSVNQDVIDAFETLSNDNVTLAQDRLRKIQRQYA